MYIMATNPDQRQELEAAKESFPPQHRNDLLREAHGRPQERPSCKSKNQGDEGRERNYTTGPSPGSGVCEIPDWLFIEPHPSNQGQERSKGWEGAIRANGSEDAPKESWSYQEKREAKQAAQFLSVDTVVHHHDSRASWFREAQGLIIILHNF